MKKRKTVQGGFGNQKRERRKRVWKALLEGD
jgi:hypothetical protein